jgi:hypothetical protein
MRIGASMTLRVGAAVARLGKGSVGLEVFMYNS